jgi:dGTPase
VIKRRNVRRILEDKEESLSPYAARSRLSRGRLRAEEPCAVRTEFQHDRDRIIHSNSFRRLKHKTQVFIAPAGDHYVTRLSHTLEVSQIARTISRALNLNEDLTEAISLGHDMGHTPFGHIGEDVLDELFPEGFKHNEQSLRVVDILENDGKGLNLTWEVRDGILNHSKSRIGIMKEGWGSVNTLEGEICKLADIIAYINHDIDDAIRAGLLDEDDLPLEATTVLGNSRSQRINTLVCDIIDHSWAIRTGKTDKPVVVMGSRVLKATNILRDFLFEKVYNPLSRKEESDEAREVVRFLYRYFIDHAEKLPQEYSLSNDSIERRVVDYIAGMTDQYALRMEEELSHFPRKRGITG